MPPLIEPSSESELAAAVRSAPHVVPVGAGTKPRLVEVGEKFTRISTARLRGIIEYDPSEFTFTARAGTPLREIMAALAERGQYLPFDPPFAEAGATLAGTVAAGLSGPGRFRFGGLRDFILAVQFADGEGRLLRMGGKVVKNAAGFDVPKFFVGSLGRFGIMTEITFKVFPRPMATRTLRLVANDAAAKVRVLTEAAAGRWEIDSLEAAVEEGAVFVRLAGPAEAFDALGNEIFSRWPGSVLLSGDADNFWRSLAGFRWAHSNGTLARVALLPSQVEAFVAFLRTQPNARGWIGAGGNVGYVSVPAGTPLATLVWPGVTLRGDASLWHGPQPRFEVMKAVKTALDPQQRFPSLDE